MTDGYLAHAPGYVLNEGPKLVTSRFELEDSFTLERYEATGGYQGLRAALDRTPDEVHAEIRDATLLGRGGAGFPRASSGASAHPASGRGTWSSTATRASPAPTRTACSWSAIPTSSSRAA